MSWLDWLKTFFVNPQPHGDHGAEGEVSLDLDVDIGGWLEGPGVVTIPSARRYIVGKPPRAIVWHWTATGNGSAANLAKAIVDMPRPGQRSASWHLLIARDGTIYQSVSLLDGSWHCAAGEIDGVRPNKCSVGIEIECVGRVKDFGEKGFRRGWPYDKRGPAVSEAEVFKFGKSEYHTFTDDQLKRVQELLELLARKYNITNKNLQWGHLDLDPTRKEDPGPYFKKEVLPKMVNILPKRK